MKRLSAFLFVAAASPAAAAAMNRPFSVGGGEGGGPATGIVGWILAEQAQLTHLMSGALKGLHDGPQAIWGLAALGFAYGVLHAAGPGHGKALIASYMLANERALKRGLVMAFLAAMLQGAVAVALVGVAALIFAATASEINVAANWLELASYAGIAAVGAWLVYKKGAAFLASASFALASWRATKAGLLYAGAPWAAADAGSFLASGFRAEAPDAMLDPDCGHIHAPDPRLLGNGFSLRAAALTVLAAGARPCSGAILMLAFSLAQGLFFAGVLATFAISLGTALTTGALACLAVFAKDAALRFVGAQSRSGLIIARGIELAAALLVLAFGLALFYAGAASG